MYDIVDRLIEAGHADKVFEASQFAKIKADIPGVRWEADTEHPTNELFAAINGMSDPAELNELSDYIWERCPADDYELDELDAAA